MALLLMHSADHVSVLNVFSYIVMTPFIQKLYSMELDFIQNCYDYFGVLMSKLLPDTYVLLKHHGISKYNFLIGWFTSFFLHDFSVEIAVVVFNGFISGGPQYLFLSALALLSLLYPEITSTPFKSPSLNSLNSSNTNSTSGSIIDLEQFVAQLTESRVKKNLKTSLVKPTMLVTCIKEFENICRKENFVVINF
jgi:hypothetical protein